MSAPRYWLRRYELLRNIGYGAMDSSAILVTVQCAIMPVAMLRQVLCEYTGSSTTRLGNLSSAFEKADSQWKQIFKCRLSQRHDEFHAPIGNLFPNTKEKTRRRSKL
jgi:hypothetical protein